MTDNRIIELTADIVSAHVSNNSVAATEVPALISSIFAALTAAESPAPAEIPKAEPAVPIRSSVKNEYIICLEDGAKLKMLKRYLRTNFDMTPEDYRAKWGLPRDYPMVAPAYAEQRRTLAQKIGLGRKKAPVSLEADAAPAAKTVKSAKSPKSAAKVVDTAQAAPKKRGRPSKAAALVDAPASDVVAS